MSASSGARVGAVAEIASGPDSSTDRHAPVRPLWLVQPAREGVVAAVVTFGAFVVVGLWWFDTPAASLHGLGEELTAIGRITGLLGTYLLLIAVLLAARIPWLDGSIGMDRLTVWHRRVGEYVVALLAVHAVATVVGYAFTDRISVARETVAVVLHYPDMLSATVALALLVAVGAVSARVVRPMMAYRTWYFIHLYVYLAVILGFAHQLATGNEFVGHLWTRAFWVAVHLAVLGLLVAYRVITPIRSVVRHRLRVARVVREGPDVTTVYFSGAHLDELPARAGQYFMWRFLTRDGWWRANPYSLSAAPDGRHLRITVKHIGDNSRALATLQPGTPVMAEGPYGNVTLRRRRQNKVLLVAGGIGVAPLRAMLESLPPRSAEVTVLYRASTQDHVVLRDELDDLASSKGARIAYIVGPRKHDPFRREMLVANIADVAAHDAFVFGPAGFVDHAVDALRAAGIPSRHIHAERFEF